MLPSDREGVKWALHSPPQTLGHWNSFLNDLIGEEPYGESP